MKNLIYNSLLALIGIVIVYIICVNYLGSNKHEEGFEASASTTTYNPADQTKNNTDAIKTEAKADPALVPNNSLSAKDVASAPPASFVASKETAAQAAAPAVGDNFCTNDDNCDSDGDEEAVGILSKLYNYIFPTEAFVSHPGSVPRTSNYYRRSRTWSWSGWRSRHRNWHNQRAAYWRAYRAWRTNWWRWYYWRQGAWRRAQEAKARAAAAAAKAAALRKAQAAAAAAAPFIQMHANSTRGVQLVKDATTAANRTITHSNERNMMGRDSTRDFKLKYMSSSYPWGTWNHQGWINSAQYWLARRKPRSGVHWRWQPMGGSAKAIAGINAKVADKKRRDAEAKKSNLRTANWQSLQKKIDTKLGPFNPDAVGKASATQQTTLSNKYGISTHIRDWKAEKIQEAHKYIDETYDNIQLARKRAALQAAAFSMQQKQAAELAAQEAAGASKAMADAAREAQAQAAKESAKEAQATARAVANMTNTLRTTDSKIGVHKGKLDGYMGRAGGFNALNQNTINAATSTRNTIKDLLTLQSARIGKVNAVPMDSIKAISLKARQNYDASLKS